jgi:rhamnose utilization protein RhaD (predicted bifunctional aldolase and dehydrogenase)
MSLQDLAEISRFYGSNSDYVIAGGGNASFKDRDYLYIKASGTSLAEARPGDFVKMNRASLGKIWEKTYPADTEAREAAVLTDMMAARAPGEEGKRPSVETLLHDILPFAFVVHSHPSLVNGLTCARNGREAARELFPESLWLPSINPGYILSNAVKDAMDKCRAENGKAADAIFLQNHGIFVGADTIEGIKSVYGGLMKAIEGRIKRKPDDLDGEVSSPEKVDSLAGALKQAAVRISGEAACFVQFERGGELSRFLAGKDAFAPLSSAFTPDHIVYAGSDPLFLDSDAVKNLENAAALEQAMGMHREKTGRLPKIVAIQGLGVFGLDSSEKAAANAVELFKDAAKVAVYTESFGGPLFMPPEQIAFINNWEVERYRSKVSA